MAIKLYNTLTNKKERFNQIVDNTVRMYNCGPTVYSYAHVGNFRYFLFVDLLKRFFELEGLKVIQVMNITDVGHLTNDSDDGEDKIQKQAEKEKIDPLQISKKYTKAFFNDSALLKIEPADFYPKATDHINEMIEIIKVLIEKGFAYENNGNVYFDISKFSEYGKLSGMKLDELESSTRAIADPNKKHKNDFALWFSNSKYKNHIMKWDSPWGEGYPGWHIECSAMSMKYLSPAFEGGKFHPEKFQTIDIHTGGEDNKFPHHDSEIAQTEGATSKKFSNFWLHVKHLIVNGEKMSKSLGNVYTLSDLTTKGFTPSAIRLEFLSTHYRQTLNFTFEGITAAQANIDRIQEVVDKLLDITKEGDSEYPEFCEEYRDKFRDALSDDLNVSQAFGITFQFITELNKLISTDKLNALDAGLFLNYFMDFNKIFDVIRFEKEVIPDSVLNLADQRLEAKKNKKYVEADVLRDKIKELGYLITDTKGGNYKLKKL